MKTLPYHILFIMLLAFSNNLMAQCVVEPQAISYLEGNDVKAIFRNGGNFFWNGIDSATYETGGTAGQQGTSSIFASSLWLASFDAGGNLRTSCQTYRFNGNDFWAGPLDNNAQPIDCNGYDRIWSIKGSTVRALLADFYDNGVIDNPIHNSILAWPARGNSNSPTLNNLTLPNQDLAPFFDRNADNIYNPYDGDYPIADPLHPTVIADHLLWMVINDNGNVHTQTNGNPIKAEVHITAYAFQCALDPVVNKSIFVRYKIINKNPIAMHNFKAGIWTDFDLGCPEDDYIGSIPSMNTIYAYNADNNDGVACVHGGVGYGVNPPVQALTLLNQTMSNSMYHINNFGTDLRGFPSSAWGYYRLLGSQWAGSTPLTWGEDGYDTSNPTTTSYVFPDNPNDANGWSMVSQNITGLDQRVLASMTQDTFLSMSSIELTTAYSYHRDLDSSNLQNVNLMYQQIPMLQSFYDDGYNNRNCSHTVAIQNINSNADFIKIYPNPAQHQLTIESQEENLESVELFSVLGQSVYQVQHINNNSVQVDVSNLPQGMYLVKVQSDKKTWSQKVQLVK